MKTPAHLLFLLSFALPPLSAEENGKTPPTSAPAKGKGGANVVRDLDQDGDRFISKEEAGKRWERLGKLDTNGDEKVSAQELRAARPQTQANKKPGKAGEPGKRKRAPGNASTQPNRTKGAPAKGSPAKGAPAKGAPGEFFKRADKNGDGKVTKDEVPAESWARLGKADKNQDGAVTREELMGSARAGGGPAGGGARMFDRLDKNKDGELTQDEAPGEMWTRISKADKDGNGALSKEEFSALPPARGAAAPRRRGQVGPQGGPAAIFSRYDSDKDGKITKSEAPIEMWEKLSKADANADGLVSREELETVYRDRGNVPADRPKEKKPESTPPSA